MSLDWTKYKPVQCQGCPLHGAPGPVFGVGDPAHAIIIYIPQNPGKHEVEARPMQPLIGPSGNVFNYQCGQVGLRRDQMFITNQVKCLTPDNREPTPEEVRCCKPLLDKELARCKADTVVLAGKVSFEANIGHYSTISGLYKPSSSIFERMGCVEIKDGRKWIGTIHPAFVMRMPEWREAANDHLRKAMTVAGLDLPAPKIIQHPTDEEVVKGVDHIMLASREFADDVETVGVPEVEEDDYCGADFQMTMCGVSGKPYEAFVCDPHQIPLLAPIYSDPEIWCYEHNGQYERYHISKVLGQGYMKAKYFDTMLATHYLRSYAPKKLKPYCVSQYTLLPYYNRDLGKVNMRLYNGMDNIATLLVGKEERRLLVKWQLEELFWEFGMPILPILEELRQKGLRVDERRALLFKKITEAKIAKAEQLITKAVGPFFNHRSHIQRKELLYEKFKLPVQYKKTPGQKGVQKITTDFEARKRLRWWIESSPEKRETFKVANIVLQLLDFISGEEKKLEYIGRISGDGRIHPYYKAHGEAPFRLSSTPNVQNFPVYDISAWGGARRDDNATAQNPLDLAEEKDEARVAAPSEQGATRQLGSLRSLVLPDTDEDLILTCDYEQLQLWIYAKQFNVKWLLSVFESREYIYGVVYEHLYKEPFFQEGKPRTKKYKLPVPEQRIRRAKAVPLGFLFGRSADAVSAEYGWDPSEGRKLRSWWYGLNPELEESYGQIKYRMLQQGYLRHCFGQIIHYPSKKLTEAINSHAQSPEAFIVMGSIIKIDHEFKRRGWKNTRIMLSVHDSISINVAGARVFPERMVECYEEVVKPILERPIPQLGGFRFRHSSEVSRLWDWEVESYDKWKARVTGGIREDVPSGAQSA